MTKTYGERRQSILFTAAREMRKLAGHILDDVVEEAEIKGQTAAWAKSQAAKTAFRANDLENEASAECWVSPQTRAANTRSHTTYANAVTRFQKRLHAHGVDASALIIS